MRKRSGDPPRAARATTDASERRANAFLTETFRTHPNARAHEKKRRGSLSCRRPEVVCLHARIRAIERQSEKNDMSFPNKAKNIPFPRSWRRACRASPLSPAVEDRAADARQPRFTRRSRSRVRFRTPPPSGRSTTSAKRSNSDASRFCRRARMPMPVMGALSFASRVVPGAGAFELSRASRRRRVALNVRTSPAAALDAKPATRWTEPPPFPEVRSARARDRSLFASRASLAPSLRTCGARSRRRARSAPRVFPVLTFAKRCFARRAEPKTKPEPKIHTRARKIPPAAVVRAFR